MATRRKRKRTRRRKSRSGKRTRRTKRKRLRKKMRRKSRGGKRRRKQKGGFCAGPTACMTSSGFRTSKKCAECIGKHWVAEIKKADDMIYLGFAPEIKGVKNELYLSYQKYTGRHEVSTYNMSDVEEKKLQTGNRKLARLVINEIVKRMLFKPDSDFAKSWAKSRFQPSKYTKDRDRGWQLFLGINSPICQLQSSRFYGSSDSYTRVDNTPTHNLLRDIHETFLLLQQLETTPENYYANCAIADWIMQEKPEILIKSYTDLSASLGDLKKQYNWNLGKGRDIYKITYTYTQSEIDQLKMLYKQINNIDMKKEIEVETKDFDKNEVTQLFMNSPNKSKYIAENLENMGGDPLPIK